MELALWLVELGVPFRASPGGRFSALGASGFGVWTMIQGPSPSAPSIVKSPRHGPPDRNGTPT